MGAPAAHSLVMDGLSLRTPGERDQLRVEVPHNTMTYVMLEKSEGGGVGGQELRGVEEVASGRAYE